MSLVLPVNFKTKTVSALTIDDILAMEPDTFMDRFVYADGYVPNADDVPALERELAALEARYTLQLAA